MNQNLQNNKEKLVNRESISAVVLTKNEEKNIIDCLKSIQWCDEIIIIDSSDTKDTIDLAEKTISTAKVKIINIRRQDDFSLLRNSGLKEASKDWVFFVDADHRVSPELKAEILEVLSPKSPFTSYRVRQIDHLYSKTLNFGETAQIYHILLVKRGIGKWQRRVHETLKIDGSVGILKNTIDHYPHQSIQEFIDHINRWSSLDAQEFKSRGTRGTLFKLFIYPAAKFIQNYIFRLGFLDGFPGLIMAFIMSLHSLTVRVKMME